MPLYLKEWRTALGVTRDRLAQLIDKSVPTIQRWESGVRTPGVDDIDMLARVLEISPHELLLNPKDAFSLRNATTLTPEERALLEQFRSSPPQARRTAHAALDAWKEHEDDEIKENKAIK